MTIKGQHLVDFAAELILEQDVLPQLWCLNVDGSSDKRGGGAYIVLEGWNGVIIEQALIFKFQTSNSQAEYEALIVDLMLAKELEVTNLERRTNFQLVVGHMNETF